MPVLEFDHFNLRAERGLLDALRDFYVGVVGLTVGDRPPFGVFGYWLYLGDRPILHLVDDAAAPRAGEAPHTTFDHVAFTCSGFAAFEARLRQLGVEYRRVQIPGSRRMQLFVRDPAGNGVEFNFASSDS